MNRTIRRILSLGATLVVVAACEHDPAGPGNLPERAAPSRGETAISASVTTASTPVREVQE